MPFTCFLFDLDNTLLHIPNRGHYFDNVLIETLKSLEIRNIPDIAKRNAFWSSGQEYIRVLKEWDAKNPQSFWKNFDDIDFRNRKRLIKENKLNLYHDVINTLDALRNKNGSKLALISNASHYIVDYIIERFEISHYFHGTFGLGFNKDEEIAKPSPNGILRLLKEIEHDSPNADILMVGDSYVDVYAAKRAGITACLIRRDPDRYKNQIHKWDHKPDFIIENLDEILKI